MGRKSYYVHFSWKKLFSTLNVSTCSGGPVVLFFAYGLSHCWTSQCFALFFQLLKLTDIFMYPFQEADINS